MTMINVNDFPQCIAKGLTSCNEKGQKFAITDMTKKEQQVLMRIKVDRCIYNDSDLNTRCDYIFELKDISG